MHYFIKLFTAHVVFSAFYSTDKRKAFKVRESAWLSFLSKLFRGKQTGRHGTLSHVSKIPLKNLLLLWYRVPHQVIIQIWSNVLRDGAKETQWSDMIFWPLILKWPFLVPLPKCLRFIVCFFDTLQQQQVGQMKKFHFVIIFLVSGKQSFMWLQEK